MQMTTAYSIHNRGTFQSGQALSSGGANRDRQSGGETYVPYQQGDQVQFAKAAPAWPSDSAPASGFAQFGERLFNLDIRIITSAIATVIFAVMFQAVVSQAILTTLLSLVFFVGWYIMSFFDFQRVLYNAQHGPRQMRHMHHQVPATF